MNARIPSIDVSPAGMAALKARIDAAREARQIRADSIAAAQRVYSKYRLRDTAEILRALQNLESAIDLSQNAWIKERLAELCSDIEDDQIAPELPSYAIEPRGEFDSQTIRSNHG